MTTKTVQRVVCGCGRKIQILPGVTNVFCSCGSKNPIENLHVQTVTVKEKRNPWEVIHARYARAILSQQWNHEVELAWYLRRWLRTVPRGACGSCQTHWKDLTTDHPIDFSNPQAAFKSIWFLHNEVSRLYANHPTITLEQAYEIWVEPLKESIEDAGLLKPDQCAIRFPS